MSNAVLETIELVKQEIADLERQLNQKKTTVNGLYPLAKIDPIYVIEDQIQVAASAALNGDEYYSKKASTAVRMVLEARKARGSGPATSGEIYDALLAGGYKFDAKNEANAKNSLRVTLSKNSSIFHRLPNKKVGLTKWYNVKPAKTVLKEKEEEGVGVMDKEFRGGSKEKDTQDVPF